MKALEILKQVKELSGWIKCGAELPFDEKIDEAISELEEAMKPKNCDGCKYASYDDECEEYCYSSDTYECRDCYRSGYEDNFMAKDNQ